MTTFEIDYDKSTKYKEVLEGIEKQGLALHATHNPNTWRLAALTYALHLHDCIILFSQLKSKWREQLPFSEAWDVDFTDWKSRVWTAVNNVSSFTEEPGFADWERLCEEDYQTFLGKANACLGGSIPLKDLIDFLSEKKTELKKVIIDTGQDLSKLLSDIEEMLYNSNTALYEQFYEDLANIYINETENPYQIDDNGIPIPYERWKASKSRKKLPDLLLSKIRATNTSMREIKFWQETWDECFNIEKQEIDKEGFARFIFQHRKDIIENKNYPCKNCLGRCFAALCLCEHLWDEHNILLASETDTEEASPSVPNITTLTLTASRQAILGQLLDYADKGEWARGITTEDIKTMLRTVLGQGETLLCDEDAEMSETLWHLLENGRGDRVKIVWQNLVGYMDDKKLLRQKGSPALNKVFFGNEEKYSNIDKGRPSRDNMSSGFKDVLPLLDTYVPEVDKKCKSRQERTIN